MRKCLPQSKFKRGTNVQVRISMDGKQRKQGEAKLTTGGEEKEVKQQEVFLLRMRLASD